MLFFSRADEITESLKQSKRLTSKYRTSTLMSDNDTITLELSARLKEHEGRLSLHKEGNDISQGDVEQEVKDIMK